MYFMYSLGVLTVILLIFAMYQEYLNIKHLKKWLKDSKGEKEVLKSLGQELGKYPEVESGSKKSFVLNRKAKRL